MSVKKIAVITGKCVLLSFIVIGIILFLNQRKIAESVYGGFLSQVFHNFTASVGRNGPAAVIKNWFSVETDNFKVSEREKLVQYKLQILAKSLNNYFSSLLSSTADLVSSAVILRHMDGAIYNAEQNRVKNNLETYMKNNSDIMEVSLWNIQGDRISSVKYRNISTYLVNRNIFSMLRDKSNILLKSSESKYLILISAVKKEGLITGYISQTLNPVFFTKILDFLNINDNLFYIKNTDNELVLDNYPAYQFINNEQSYSYLFYRKLTRAREENLAIAIDKVSYSLGVIIEENNAAGQLISLTALTIIIILSLLLTNFIWNNTVHLLSSFRGNEKEIFAATPVKSEPGPMPSVRVTQRAVHTEDESFEDSIDREIEKLKKRAFVHDNQVLVADSFVHK